MQCPYCVQEVSDEAVVCKTCQRDLYTCPPVQRRFRAFVDRVEGTENGGASSQPPPGAVTNSSDSRAGSRTSRLIGVPAVLLLVVWFDFRIGAGVSGDKSNQFAWASWLLESVLLSLWLAFYRRSNWTVAVCAALARSFEKAFVMAYCWLQHDVAMSKAKPPATFPPGSLTFYTEFQNFNVWLGVFVPELCVFLSAYWLGQWLKDVSHTKGVGESQVDFDKRVQRFNSLMTALAPVLSLVGALLVAVINSLLTKDHGH